MLKRTTNVFKWDKNKVFDLQYNTINIIQILRLHTA